MAKNLLGAIPAATYFILVLRDFRGISKKFLMAAGSFIIILLVYYVPLYFASPQTFKTEILVGFFHFKNLEGWERPWYFYITNYLPQRYLGNWTWVFYALLILGIMYRVKGRGERKDKILLNLSLGWFLWNLIAISLVTSKVPNFIYQSYLLSLFFVVYAVVTFVSSHFDRLARSLFLKGVSLASSSTSRSGRFVRDGAVVLLVISFTITGYEGYMFAQQFKIVRAAPYNYQTEHEKFYQTAEEFRGMGLDTKDLIILRVSDNDCWFRYYPLFLTGTESKTLLEMYFGFDPNAIKQKYNQMYFVMNKTDQLNEGKVLELTNYKIEQFDITKMTVDQINSAVANFIADHKQDIPQDILRIKKDKTSCQWLVPDPILNAP